MRKGAPAPELMKMVATGEYVSPGTILAEENTYTLGFGTLCEDGNIVSALSGTVFVNTDSNTISVERGGSTVLTVEKGDYVIGTVAILKEKSAEAIILQVEGKPYRNILPNQLYGQMHVASLVDRFLHQPKDCMRRRDIIRAIVTDTEPVVRISMRGDKKCGVLHALCPSCGKTLVPKSNGDYNVACPECDYKGFRVLSDGYGSGYELPDNGPSNMNNSGKRWSREMEEVFNSGNGRSILLAADHRNDGRKVSLSRGSNSGGSKFNKIFIGGLSQDVEESDLKELFSKYGELASVSVIKDAETGRSRGFGFVEMIKRDEANAAISALHQTSIKGKSVSVRDAGDKKGKERSPRRERPKGSKMFVGGISWDTKDDDLKKLFSEHGKVLDLFIMKDRETGKSKGFGFVTMSEADAKKAIQKLNGNNFMGRNITVAEAKESGGSNNSKKRSKREERALKEEGLDKE